MFVLCTMCTTKAGVLPVIRYDAGVILCFNKIVVTKQLPSLRGMWTEKSLTLQCSAAVSSVCIPHYFLYCSPDLKYFHNGNVCILTI